MSRLDLDNHLSKIDALVEEINNFVPSTDHRAVQFRADLAGLLVVAMAASYESCVKEVLVDFASRHHAIFGGFAQRNYEKLSSRVQVKDLKRYCAIFDPAIHDRFRCKLSERKKAIQDRVGRNIEVSYEQILAWRHAFAHAGIRQTTIEEAAATHKVGKRVLYIFDDAFNRP